MKSALESADSRIRRRENSSRRMRRGRRVGNLPTKFMGSLRWLRNRKKADRSARSSKGQPCNFTRRSAAKKKATKSRGTFSKHPKSYLQTVIRLPLPSLSGCPSVAWTHLPKGVLGPRVTPLDAGAFLYSWTDAALVGAIR